MSKAIVDFETMNVVSVTRAATRSGESVVRYLDNGQYYKFYTLCSDEEHDELARQFQEYLTNKNSGVI